MTPKVEDETNEEVAKVEENFASDSTFNEVKIDNVQTDETNEEVAKTSSKKKSSFSE